MWRKLPDFQVEKKAQNAVTSLAVMVFSVPIERIKEGLSKACFICTT